MMNAAAVRVRLGQDDPVAGDLVDGSDMLVVASDHLHVLMHLAQHAALVLPFLSPAAEIAFELRLVLAPIVVIVAVELAHVAVAPAMIMRVELAALTAIPRAGEARPPILIAPVGRLRPLAVPARFAQRRLAAAV